MVGGTTLGYWLTGNPKIATTPMSTVTSAMTLARTGRSMKNFEITPSASLFGPASLRSRRGLGLRLHLLARHRPLQPSHHDIVFGGQAAIDNPHRIVCRAECHTLLL